MAFPDNATIFIPNQEEKDRLKIICDKVINTFTEAKLPDYEVAYVLRVLVESYQEIHKCYIPIAPNKVHLLVNFMRSEKREVRKE